MKKLYTVGETAKLVSMTTETLRHYDRIGLIKPCMTDEITNYRYYSDQEIVHLNTIQALRCMDLSLEKIKHILSFNDFRQIIEAFRQAEHTAEEKIIAINHAKKKIATARVFYESKMKDVNKTSGSFIETIPERVILIAETLKFPSLDNLWDYHRHFYSLIDYSMKTSFIFEDLAGIYQDDDISGMFAVCAKYAHTTGIRILPKGDYLCANCSEKNRLKVLDDLVREAKTKYNIIPKFTIQMIILTGVLQWDYRIQVYIGNDKK